MKARWSRVAAVAGPVLLFALPSLYEVWFGPIFGGTTTGPKPLLTVFLAVISIGLGLRLRYPLLALVLVMGGQAAHALSGSVGLGEASLNLLEVFLAFVFIVYSTAAHTSRPRTYVGAAIIVALQLLTYGPSLPGSLSQAFGEWVFYALAWALGKTLQFRERRSDHLEARAVELESRRAAQIEAAVVDERARIARELHDIVGHSVSLMVLQAGAARQALDGHPEKAREPLLSVEATGRAAMAELRRLVGMLRQPGQHDELEPQPSLTHLETLAANLREAGLAVDLDVQGGIDDIPPGIDLSAYRIVQEALTNVMKHAAATHADVHITRRDGTLEVLVEDNGLGSPTASPGNGHGLIGMRERVSLYGGSFEAGARNGGGFRIYARLPYEVP